MMGMPDPVSFLGPFKKGSFSFKFEYDVTLSDNMTSAFYL